MAEQRDTERSGCGNLERSVSRWFRVADALQVLPAPVGVTEPT
jgi:hypothetical protein